MEDITLDSLVGEHELTGVDLGKTGDGSDCTFCLDGKTYIAMEDENDGYRSALGELKLSDTAPKNTFPAVKVVAKKSSNLLSDDTLQILNQKTGELILEVGTDNSDDYYPSFVSHFQPENL